MLTVIIPCKNQDSIVNLAIDMFRHMPTPPDNILVLNDRSDTFNIKEDSFVNVLNTADYGISGRSATRNLGIQFCYEIGTDRFIFIDGDSVPRNSSFIKQYNHEFDENENQLLIGLRNHVNEISYKDVKLCSGKINKYPSDYLTTNQDNFSLGLTPTNEDLRKVSKMNKYFNASTTFEEKSDHMLSGWVMWSCNFGISKIALDKLQDHNNKVFGSPFWFDEIEFTKWGYEDIAFGLDALYSDVDVNFISVYTEHLMHDRSDELFTHIEGKSLIYKRYRKLLLHRLKTGL